MTAIAANVAKMIDMLPEEDQKFAQEFVKSLCLLGIPISRRSLHRKQKVLNRPRKVGSFQSQI